MDWFANTFPEPCNWGGTLTITVTGGTPNATLKVQVRDGEGVDDEVEIVTDGQGNGAVEYLVPHGRIRHPRADDHGVRLAGVGDWTRSSGREPQLHDAGYYRRCEVRFVPHGIDETRRCSREAVRVMDLGDGERFELCQKCYERQPRR